jgi:hypothetical protein
MGWYRCEEDYLCDDAMIKGDVSSNAEQLLSSRPATARARTRLLMSALLNLMVVCELIAERFTLGFVSTGPALRRKFPRPHGPLSDTAQPGL